MTPQTITIQTIRLDGNTQSRAEINNDIVADYARAVGDGDRFPPVIVFFDGVDNWLADGFHRVHGHIAAGKTSIGADVRTGTQRDAQIFSFGVNGTHGLRRTNADKRKAVTTMLEDAEWSKWSDHVVARNCAVTQPFVSKVRSELITVIGGDSELPAAVAEVGIAAPAFTGSSTTLAAPANAQSGSSSTSAPVKDRPAAVQTVQQLLAAKLAEEAHGESDLGMLVDELETENKALQAQVAAANADDVKAEVIKYQRIASIAQSRQNELMATVNDREQELKKTMTALRRCGAVVNEETPARIAAAVEAMGRTIASMLEAA